MEELTILCRIECWYYKRDRRWRARHSRARTTRTMMMIYGGASVRLTRQREERSLFTDYGFYDTCALGSNKQRGWSVLFHAQRNLLSQADGDVSMGPCWKRQVGWWPGDHRKQEQTRSCLLPCFYSSLNTSFIASLTSSSPSAKMWPKRPRPQHPSTHPPSPSTPAPPAQPPPSSNPKYPPPLPPPSA